MEETVRRNQWRTSRGIVVGVAALGLAGCAFDRGEPFGVLTGTIEARYALSADRDRGGGWQKLDSEHELRIDAASSSVDLVEVARAALGGERGFDPSRPPEGYGLCHNGHCHRDDGALVPYAEIEAELATTGAEPALSLLPSAGGAADLLAPAPIALGCGGACLLEAGRLVRARVALARLEASGLARGGLPGASLAGEIPLRLRADLLGREGAPRLDTALDVVLDDEAPPHVALALGLTLGAALFDGVALATLERRPDGAIEISAAANPQALVTVLEHLGEAELRATVTRNDP
jgi:hypothetical protein